VQRPAFLRRHARITGASTAHSSQFINNPIILESVTSERLSFLRSPQLKLHTADLPAAISKFRSWRFGETEISRDIKQK
jgi:hypothetical protein